MWAIWQGGTWWAGICFFLAALGLGLTPIASQLASREGLFRRFALSRATSGVTQATSHVGFGLASFGTAGLLLGYGLCFLAGVAVLWDRVVAAAKAKAGQHRWISRSVFRSSVTVSAASLVNSLVVAAPVLLISFLYAKSDVGQFTVAQRLVVVPAGLAVSAISPVIAARVGESLRSGDRVAPVVAKHLRTWAPIGLGVFVLPWLLPQQWVSMALGSEWTEVTHYMRALSPLIASLMVCGPLSQVLTMSGQGAVQLWWDCSRFVLVFGAAISAKVLGAGPVVMCTVISAVFALGYLVHVRLSLRVDRIGSRFSGGDVS